VFQEEKEGEEEEEKMRGRGRYDPRSTMATFVLSCFTRNFKKQGTFQYYIPRRRGAFQ
jgi:hypothetical protein